MTGSGARKVGRAAARRHNSAGILFMGEFGVLYWRRGQTSRPDPCAQLGNPLSGSPTWQPPFVAEARDPELLTWNRTPVLLRMTGEAKDFSTRREQTP